MSDDLAWETTARETAYTCPGFDVIEEAVTLPDGTETEFHHLAEGDSVVVIPFTPEGELVLIEEWRQAVKRVNRAVPAGNVEDEDGDLEVAAHRELAEETGHVADSMKKLTVMEPANGLADTVFHYFVACGCTREEDQSLDHNESIRVTTVGYEEFLAEVRDGECRDGRTMAGICFYELFENRD